MNDLNWVFVSSSNLSRVAYDEINQFLYIEFINNSIYLYKNVPVYEYDQLLRASSPGGYLNAYIKPSYPCDKIG
ncbi:MAG: KTSC domain-containing protein [Candidatus Izemoplasmataceae bacterium]